MKTINFFKKLGIIFFLSIVFTCGEDAASIIYIAGYDAIWPVQNKENYYIGIFRNGASDTSSGSLHGSEDNPDDTKQNDIVGTFDGLNIELTIERTSGDVKFTGKMTPRSETDHFIIRVDLKSSSGEKLVLIR